MQVRFVQPLKAAEDAVGGVEDSICMFVKLILPSKALSMLVTEFGISMDVKL